MVIFGITPAAHTFNHESRPDLAVNPESRVSIRKIPNPEFQIGKSESRVSKMGNPES